MSETEINLIPLADLPARYRITRSVIYDRLSALNIEPTRFGKKAFVKAHDLKLLDSLDEHLKLGGITSEFTAHLSGIQTATDTRQINSDPGQASKIEDQKAILTLMEALVNRLGTHSSSQLDPLSDYEALEKAYRNGWLLSTSRLASVLGLSSKTLRRHQELSRYGFVFTKNGRNGTQVAWKVSKI